MPDWAEPVPGFSKIDATAIENVGLHIHDAVNQPAITDLNSVQLSPKGYIAGGTFAYNTGIGLWMGWDVDAYKMFLGDAAGDKLLLDGSSLQFTGSIIAGSLHVPDVDTTANSWHVNTAGDMWLGATQTNFNADNDNAAAYILKTGVAHFQSVTLDTAVVLADLQSGSEIAIQDWSFSGAFSVTDLNTVAWGSGTLTLLDGTTYSIDAGNTGDMAAYNYIYLDIGTSTTVLQVSTSFTSGSGKILIATAQNGTSEASYLLMGGDGTYNLDGGNIAAASIIANKLSVSQLSAITADLGTITAGTVTGATIQTAASGDRFVMTSNSFQGIEIGGNTIFEIVLIGANAGDVIMGDDATGQFAQWDDSASTFSVNGSPLAFQNVFGDASDGDVVISANTTLTEDMFYDDLTVDATKVLNTGGYRVHVAGILTVNGTISRDGVVGGAGGTGETQVGGGSGAGGLAGAAGAALADGSVKGAIAGVAGAVGAVGVNSQSNGNNGVASGVGTDVAKSLVTNNGAAGAKGGGRYNGYAANVGSAYGGSQWVGGTSLDASAVVGTRTGTVFNKPNTAFGAWLLYDVFPAGDYLKSAPSGTGGAGGASGGADDSNPETAASGGGGGGGASGGPGGICPIYARTITIGAAGIIRANGGVGGAGGAGGTGDRTPSEFCVAGGSSGGGGGAGGNGGVVLLAYTELTNSGTLEAAGGTGGAGGAGEDGTSVNGEGTGAWQWQAGATGATGSTGNAGTVIQLEV